MKNSDDAQPNQEQVECWNERSGPVWVARQAELDAQLEPLGIAVADALALVSGERVLDVGCGAGATSLMLADRVRPGHVVGVDISEPLLARARERSAGVDNLRFELADAQTFAFAKASYDAIYSRFGVMFFADPIAAFRNMGAALRAGGRCGFVCWRAMSENPAFYLPLAAALPFLPEAPPAPVLGAPGPFAFDDRDRTQSLLAAAGFDDIEIAPHDAELVFGGRADIEGAVDLALQIGPLGRALAGLDESVRARARAAVRDALAPHHGPAGVTMPSATWIVTARKPA